jgi:cytochrome oxidase Cu insertion factor (SCO1/SenC/PrrC family)
MTEIVLKPELLKGLQKVLVEYEPKNEDPILASQYLSAVVGSIVATAEIPKNDRDDILKQLIEFTQYVYDQQSNSSQQGDVESSSQPSEDAYGKWKPE